ncbi:MAG: 4-(cytidine 5'-diphospho)-2-C-methyl-D-erythritol kinase, partial [Sphingomonadaceae bacterium]
MTIVDGETAYAKINLALHVRAREPNGYHRIETLFAFAEDGDRLTVEPATALILNVCGPFGELLADQPTNLVIEAARALREAFGVRAGASIRLDKRLPIASGIGGGSADAAAALRLLTRHWGLPADADRIDGIARALGADVPACLGSRPVRGDGRGDDLTNLEDGALAGMPLLLVNPGVPVPTASVFAMWDGIDRGALETGDPLHIAVNARNDLETPARQIAPEIGAALALIARADGVILSRMSGSGATCFALFES